LWSSVCINAFIDYPIAVCIPSLEIGTVIDVQLSGTGRNEMKNANTHSHHVYTHIHIRTICLCKVYSLQNQKHHSVIRVLVAFNNKYILKLHDSHSLFC